MPRHATSPGAQGPAEHTCPRAADPAASCSGELAAGPLTAAPFLPPPSNLSPAPRVPLCSAPAAGLSPQSLRRRFLEGRAGVGRKGGRGLAGLPGPYVLNRALCVAATVRLCTAGLQPSAAAGSESRNSESRFPTAQGLRMPTYPSRRKRGGCSAAAAELPALVALARWRASECSRVTAVSGCSVTGASSADSGQRAAD